MSRVSTLLAGLGNLAHVAAAVAIAVTAVLATRELRALHEQRDLDCLWRFHEKLASEPMRTSFAALSAIPKPVTVDVLSGADTDGVALRDIANFYEMVALAVRRGYVRYEDVDAYMGNDLLTFWAGVEDAVHKLRDSEHRPQAFSELEVLAVRLRKERGYPS